MSLPIIWRLLASIISGVMIAAAYPSYDQAESAWIALIPLLIVALYSKPKQTFRYAYITGLTFWLMSISWLLRLGETGAPIIVAVIAWVLLSAYCAIYIAAYGCLISALNLRFKKDGKSTVMGNLALLILSPVIWVGLEYLRSTIFTGFSWNALGISQYKNLVIIQVSGLVGVYGVSAILVIMNTALAFMATRFTAVYRKTRVRRWNVELSVGLLVVLMILVYGTGRLRQMKSEDTEGSNVRIVAIQPNIQQVKKWPDDQEIVILKKLKMLTEDALILKPDLIVWPETALPFPVNSDPTTQYFVKSMVSGSSPLLVGSLEYVDDKVYNSSFLFETNGIARDSYRKIHLVPFGEYLPFDKMIPAIARLAPLGWSCYPGEESKVFVSETKGEVADEYRFGVLICFEDTIPALARRLVKNGARLLINQTNDAWFDGSAAAVQHMSHCVFRCVENRVNAVRSSNTGVTCFIDRTGLIDRQTRTNIESGGVSLVHSISSNVIVPDEDMSLTVYTKCGDWLFAIPCMILTLAISIFVFITNRKEKLALPSQ